MAKSKGGPDKTKKREGDGYMPDGSDLSFHGVDEVLGKADEARGSINLRDPRQVQAWLDKKAAMMQAAKAKQKPTKGAK